MRWLVIFLACIAVDLKAKDWKLVWSDEFEGSQLNYNKWNPDVNAFGGGNHELQLYTDRPKNVRVENGKLIIEAHKDHHNIEGARRNYSSARLRTKHRGDWLYGRIEVRAKLPSGRGVWPAIWMLPTDEKYGTWAASGEIDIMEYVGQKPDSYLGTLHYGDKWPNNLQEGKSYKLAKGTFTDNFHTFSLEWLKGAMRWYVDGIHWQTQKRWGTKGAKFPAPFDQRFHLLLNVAVGGNLPGPPASTTQFPVRMEVDWVRVYQQTDDGANANAKNNKSRTPIYSCLL